MSMHPIQSASTILAGKYFGTEIDEKWWKRYMHDKLFARGNGEFSYDSKAILFRRILTKDPISIEFNAILEFKIGRWHAGQWGGGNEILKVIWEKDGERLSSGCAVSNKDKSIPALRNELQTVLLASKAPAVQAH